MSKLKGSVVDILKNEVAILNKTATPTDIFKLNNYPLATVYTLGSIDEAIKEIYGYNVFTAGNYHTNNFNAASTFDVSSIEANFNYVRSTIDQMYRNTLNTIRESFNTKNIYSDSKSYNSSYDKVINESENKQLRVQYQTVLQRIAPHLTTGMVVTEYIDLNSLIGVLKPIKGWDEALWNDIAFLLDNYAIIDIQENLVDVYDEDDEEASLLKEYNDIIKYIQDKISVLPDITDDVESNNSKTHNTYSANTESIINSAVQLYFNLKNDIVGSLFGDIKNSFIKKFGDIFYTINGSTVYFSRDNSTNQDSNDQIVKNGYNAELFKLSDIFKSEIDTTGNRVGELDTYFKNIDAALTLEDKIKYVELIKEHIYFNDLKMSIFAENLSASLDGGATWVGSVSVLNRDNNWTVSGTKQITLSYKNNDTLANKSYVYQGSNNICASLEKSPNFKNTEFLEFMIIPQLSESGLAVDDKTLAEALSNNEVAIYSPALKPYTYNGFIRIKDNVIQTNNPMYLHAEDISGFSELINGNIHVMMDEFYDSLGAVDIVIIRSNPIIDDLTDIVDNVGKLVNTVKLALTFYLNTLSDLVHISYFRARVAMLEAKKDLFQHVENTISCKNKLKVTLREMFGMKKKFEQLNHNLDFSLNGIQSRIGSDINAIAVFFEKLSQLVLLMSFDEESVEFEHIRITENVLGRFTDLVDIMLMLSENMIEKITFKSYSPTAENADLLLDFKRKLLNLTYIIAPKFALNDRYIIDVDNASEQEIDAIVPDLIDALDSIIDKIDDQGQMVSDAFMALLVPIKTITKVVTGVMTFLAIFKRFPTLIDDTLLFVYELVIRNITENVLYQPIAEHYTKWVDYRKRLHIDYKNSMQVVNLGDVINNSMDIVKTNVMTMDTFIKDSISEIDKKFNRLGYIDETITESEAHDIVTNDKHYTNYIDSLRNKTDYTSVYDVDLYDLYLERLSKDQTIVYHQFRANLVDQSDDILKMLCELVLFESMLMDTIHLGIFDDEWIPDAPYTLMGQAQKVKQMVANINQQHIRKYFEDYLSKYDETDGIIEPISVRLNSDYWTFNGIYEDAVMVNVFGQSRYENGIQLLKDLTFTKGKLFKGVGPISNIPENMFNVVVDDYYNRYDDDINDALSGLRFNLLNLPDMHESIDGIIKLLEKNSGIINNSKKDRKHTTLITDVEVDGDDEFIMANESYNGVMANSLGVYIIRQDEQDKATNSNTSVPPNDDECKDIAISSMVDLRARTNNVKDSNSIIIMNMDEIIDMKAINQFFDKIHDIIEVVVKAVNDARKLTFTAAKNNLRFWDSDLNALSNKLNGILDKCSQRSFVDDVVQMGNMEANAENTFCTAIKHFWGDVQINNYFEDYNNDRSKCNDVIDNLYQILLALRNESMQAQKDTVDLMSKDEMDKFKTIIDKCIKAHSHYDVNGIISVDAIMPKIFITRFYDLYVSNTDNKEFVLFTEACNEVLKDIEVKSFTIDKLTIDDEEIDAIYESIYSKMHVYKLTVYNDESSRIITLDEFVSILSYMFTVSRIKSLNSTKKQVDDLTKQKTTMSRALANELLLNALEEIDNVLRMYNFHKVLGCDEEIEVTSLNIQHIDNFEYYAGTYNDIYISNVLAPKNKEECVALQGVKEAQSCFVFDNILRNSTVSNYVNSYGLWGLPSVYGKENDNNKVVVQSKQLYTKYLDDSDMSIINNSLFIFTNDTTDSTYGLLNQKQNDKTEEEQEAERIKGYVDLLLGVIEANSNKTDIAIMSTASSLTGASSYLTNLIASVDNEMGVAIKGMLDDISNPTLVSTFYDLLNTCIINKSNDNKLNVALPNYSKNIENTFKKYNSSNLLKMPDVIENIQQPDTYCI